MSYYIDPFRFIAGDSGAHGAGKKAQRREALAAKPSYLGCPTYKLWVTHVPAHEMPGIKALLDVWLAKVFSHFVGCCLTWLTISFAVQKPLSFMWSCFQLLASFPE